VRIERIEDAEPGGSSLWRALASPLPVRRLDARLLDIDAARGLAILLVVLGHVVAREMPAGNDWYAVLKELIYRFHMPLFMVLAGISFGLSLPLFDDWRAVGNYSWRKAHRLIVAYLFFGSLILLGKLIAAQFLHVDNPARGTLADVVALVVQPTASAAGFLWFIYVLCLYYAVLPGLMHLVGRRPVWLFAAALGAQGLDWPARFLLRDAIAYLPYFVGGVLLWIVRDRWGKLGLPAATAALAVFAGALALAIPFGLSKWLVGIISVPAALGIAQHVTGTVSRALVHLGRLSFSIYLMNTLAIGVVKALLLKGMPWDGTNFLIYFPLLTLAGLWLPMAIKQWADRYMPAASRYL
jgi:peptidoglycan/LPS O-acetylase OafA/YrhL